MDVLPENVPLKNYSMDELETRQWYLDSKDAKFDHMSDASWQGDERSAVNTIDIDYYEAMKIYDDRRETLVAVIDESIDVSLFQGTELIWLNQYETDGDGIDNDLNGYVDDVNGWDFCKDSGIHSDNVSYGSHGNSIVGILAGSNYFENYIGLFKNTSCKVMCLNAVDSKGELETVIDAIHYAENNGADICCLALSTYICNDELMSVLRNSNMLFVVAAGNDGVQLEKDILVYPAMYNFDNVITVADVRCDGKISYTSNYSNDYVDIGVPGTDILCIANYTNCEYVSGTSIATAIMTGICALTRSDNSDELDAVQLKDYICDNARKLEWLNKSIREGAFPNMYDYFCADN